MKNKIIKLVILFIYFSFVLYLIYHSSITTNISTKYYINSKNNFYHEKMISIPKINLKLYVTKAKDDFSNLSKNLVYYKHFNLDNKIIIFGHSGLGKGTYFNRLDELEKGDLLELYYEDKVYFYEVYSIYAVDKTRVDILKDEENCNKLLLVTCDKINKNDRLIVELVQKKVKTLGK